MNLMTTKLRSFALLAAIAALGAGCSSGAKSQQEPQGKAAVGVTFASLSATTITRVTLSVSTDGSSVPNDIVTPITTDLTNNDPAKKLSWSAFVQGIPVGTNRLFTVRAYDASNVAQYSGSNRSDISATTSATVTIVLQGPNDGGFTNNLPVVDSLGSSAGTVYLGGSTPPGPVTLTFKAHDPDAAATMTYQWVDTNCTGTSFVGTSATGTVDPANGNSAQWVPPTAIPTSGACTLSLKITDNKGGSVTAFLAIAIQNVTTGSATVAALVNSWPTITSLAASETFVKNSADHVVSVEYDLVASANDPDGDDIQYTWTIDATRGCNKPGDGFTNGAVTTPAASIVDASSPAQTPSSTVHFHTVDLGAACVIKVDVKDYWQTGKKPVASPALADARGGDTLGIINGSAPNDFALAPLITFYSAPNTPSQVTPNSAHYTVATGQSVPLKITVADVTPASVGKPGTPFSFNWTAVGGTIVASAPDVRLTSPGTSTYTFTANSPYTVGSFVKVTVLSSQGPSSTYTWFFDPANPCDATAATVGVTCNTGLGLCAPNGTCNLDGTCTDKAPVTCAAPGQCQLAGTCQPASGTCTFPNKPANTLCNQDTNGCTQNDFCNASGVCTVGAPVVCNTPADAQCQAAVGTCNSTGTNSFTCSYTALADTTSCNFDNNGCTQNDHCSAGVCAAGPAATCTQATNTCQATSGTCNSTGANTFSCSFANVTNGTSCNTAGVCITGQACQAGACTGGNAACPATGYCVPTTIANCFPGTAAPQVARDVQIVGPAALAMDVSGNTYVAASLNSTVAISFDGHPVASTGGSDIFVAQYGTAGTAQWAVGFGEVANDQTATGAAVTQDGTLAVIGKTNGTYNLGASVPVTSGSTVDYLFGLGTSNGAGKFANVIDNGANGVLKAVAANPKDSTAPHANRIAVCGLATGVTAVTAANSLLTVPTVGQDIVIGVYTSAGAKVWSAQVSSTGTTSNEECDAIAIDDNGDVYASGTTVGQTLNFGGATSALTGTNSSLRKATWVAKFNGATGAAISSAIFLGANNVAPTAIAVDATGDVFLGGSFTGNVTFGTTANLLTAGGTDGWVGKFSPTLGAVWTSRMGGTAGDSVKGIALDSYGDLVVTGLFNNGVATFSGTSTTVTASGSDAFVAMFNGQTGGLLSAAVYGDAATQTGDAVVVNRYVTTSGTDQITFAGTLNSSMTFPAPAGTVTATGATDVALWTATLK